MSEGDWDCVPSDAMRLDGSKRGTTEIFVEVCAADADEGWSDLLSCSVTGKFEGRNYM